MVARDLPCHLPIERKARASQRTVNVLVKLDKVAGIQGQLDILNGKSNRVRFGKVVANFDLPDDRYRQLTPELRRLIAAELGEVQAAKLGHGVDKLDRLIGEQADYLGAITPSSSSVLRNY